MNEKILNIYDANDNDDDNECKIWWYLKSPLT